MFKIAVEIFVLFVKEISLRLFLEFCLQVEKTGQVKISDNGVKNKYHVSRVEADSNRSEQVTTWWHNFTNLQRHAKLCGLCL